MGELRKPTSSHVHRPNIRASPGKERWVFQIPGTQPFSAQMEEHTYHMTAAALLSFLTVMNHPTRKSVGGWRSSQVHDTDHRLEIKTDDTWESLSYQVYNQEGRVRNTCIWRLNSLSFSFNRGSTHEMLPPTFKIDHPTEINQIKKIPQRCSHKQRFR